MKPKPERNGYSAEFATIFAHHEFWNDYCLNIFIAN
jgi:hypothetical protein